MALIATHAITTQGTAPTFAAAAADDTASTGPRVFLVVRNDDASSKTVTIAGQGTLESGAAYPDRSYTVAAGAEAWVPLLAVYRNEDSVAEISYSATTSVTRAVVSI
jgi:hypothetical protein